MEIYKYLARFVKGFLKKDKDPSVFDYLKDCWEATEVSEKRHWEQSSSWGKVFRVSEFYWANPQNPQCTVPLCQGVVLIHHVHFHNLQGSGFHCSCLEVGVLTKKKNEDKAKQNFPFCSFKLEFSPKSPDHNIYWIIISVNSDVLMSSCVTRKLNFLSSLRDFYLPYHSCQLDH